MIDFMKKRAIIELDTQPQAETPAAQPESAPRTPTTIRIKQSDMYANKLRPGTHLIAAEDMTDSAGRTVFIKGKDYIIVNHFVAPPGIVLESEIDNGKSTNWVVTFQEGGWAHNFVYSAPAGTGQGAPPEGEAGANTIFGAGLHHALLDLLSRPVPGREGVAGPPQFIHNAQDIKKYFLQRAQEQGLPEEQFTTAAAEIDMTMEYLLQRGLIFSSPSTHRVWLTPEGKEYLEYLRIQQSKGEGYGSETAG